MTSQSTSSLLRGALSLYATLNPQPRLGGSGFREARANRRAVEWLADEGLIPEGDADQYREEHPDPDVP